MYFLDTDYIYGIKKRRVCFKQGRSESLSDQPRVYRRKYPYPPPQKRISSIRLRSSPPPTVPIFELIEKPYRSVSAWNRPCQPNVTLKGPTLSGRTRGKDALNSPTLSNFWGREQWICRPVPWLTSILQPSLSRAFFFIFSEKKIYKFAFPVSSFSCSILFLSNKRSTSAVLSRFFESHSFYLRSRNSYTSPSVARGKRSAADSQVREKKLLIIIYNYHL